MTIQDALVQARLDDLHLHALSARPSEDRAPARAPAGASAGRVGLRVRLGHHLVALGAAVAGDEDRSPAHRVA